MTKSWVIHKDTISFEVFPKPEGLFELVWFLALIFLILLWTFKKALNMHHFNTKFQQEILAIEITTWTVIIIRAWASKA